MPDPNKPIQLDLTAREREERERKKKKLDDLLEWLAEEEDATEAPPASTNPEERSFWEGLAKRLDPRRIPAAFLQDLKRVDDFGASVRALAEVGIVKVGRKVIGAESPFQALPKLPSLALPSSIPLIGTPEPILPAYERVKKEHPDLSFLEALRKAGEERDAPFGQKFADALVFDVTNLVPVGKLATFVFKPTPKAFQVAAHFAAKPSGKKATIQDFLPLLQSIPTASKRVSTSSLLTHLSALNLPVPFRSSVPLINVARRVPILRAATAGPVMRGVLGYASSDNLIRLYSRNLYLNFSARLRKEFPQMKGRRILDYTAVRAVRPSVREDLEANWGVPFRDQPAYLDDTDAMTDYAVFFETDPAELNQFYRLTPGQRLFLDDLQDVRLRTEEIMKAGGLDPDTYFGKRVKNWFHRRVDKEWGLDSLDSLKRRQIGRKQAFAYDRKYHSSLEGMVEGMNYFDDPMAVMEAYVRTAYQATNDQLLIHWAKSFALPIATVRSSSDAVKAAFAAVTRLRSGAASLTPDEVKFLQQSFPIEWSMLSRGDVARAFENLRSFRAHLVREEELMESAGKKLPEVEQLNDVPLPDDFIADFRTFLLDTPPIISDLANLTPLRLTSQWMKFIATGVDAGMLFVHGSPLLGRNPVLWAKGAAQSMRVLATPEVRKAWIAENGPEMNRLATDYGVPFSSSEFTEVFQQPGLVGKALRDLPLTSPLRHFQASFDFYLDYMRFHYAKALEGAALASGKPRDLGAVVGKALGGFDTSLIGLTPTERDFASIALMFAPMYRMATLGLLLDMAKGGLRTREALRIVGGLAGAFLAYGMIGKEFTGNEDAFNPGSPKFGAIKVGGTYIGLSTPYYFLIRLHGNLVRQVKEEGPDGLARLGPDNILLEQLMRSGRAMSAPLANFGWSLYTGQNYIGDPLRDPEGNWIPWNVVTEFGGLAVPFWLENVAREGAQGVGKAAAAAPGALGEFFGLRGFPESPFSIRARLRQAFLEGDEEEGALVRWRDERVKKGLPVSWEAAPDLLRLHLFQRHVELQEIEEQIEERTKVVGRDKERRMLEFRQELEANRAQVDEGLRGIGARWEDGRIGSGQQFRDEVGEWSKALYALHLKTLRNPRYAEVQVTLAERAAERPSLVAEDRAFIGDLAFDVYMKEVLLNPNLQTEDGEFNSALFHDLDEAFKANPVFQGLYEYVQERRVAHRNIPPVVLDLKQSLQSLRPYWEVHYARWGRDSRQAREYDLLRQYPAALQDDYRRQHPTVRRVEREVKRLRTQMRRRQPELDLALTKYFDSAPTTHKALSWQRERFETISSVSP